MTAASTRKARLVPSLYEELVPLQEACAAAYHVLVEGPHESRRDDRHDMERARGLIAIAISRVATIYRAADGMVAPLDERQIRARLFSGAPGGASDLRGLFMRRGALLSAVESLKAAPARPARNREQTGR